MLHAKLWSDRKPHRKIDERDSRQRYEWLKSVAQHVIQTKKQYRFERAFDNGQFVIDVVLTPIIEKGQCTHILLVARDFTDRKKHEDELEFMAFHDPLTGAYNRAFFREQLGKLLIRNKRRNVGFSVGILDCDRFKSVNDSLGHSAGDDFAFIFDGLVASESVPYLNA